jgi:hypothetical protein
MGRKNKKWGVKQKDSGFIDLEGKTLTKIEGLRVGSYEVIFHCSDGSVYKMYPDDDSFLYGNAIDISIDDICGDVDCLIGNKIVKAEVRRSENRGGHIRDNIWADPEVWTFYTLATVKGYVDIKWYGTHNGYYSAEVSFWKEK